MKVIVKKWMYGLSIACLISVLVYYIVSGCINHQKLRFFIFAQQKLLHQKDYLSDLIKKDPCSVTLQYESDMLSKVIRAYQIKIDSAEDREEPDY